MTKECFLSFVLSGALAASAVADDLGRIRVRHETIDGVTWNYVMRGSSAALGAPGASAVPSETVGKVVVPSELNGFPVGGNITPLFRDCNKLEEVDFTNIRSSSMYGTFFQNCPSLRRVVFPRRPYSIGGMSDESPCFVNCPALEEIVFPGSVPPQLQNLGVSLDGKLRVGREFERAWRVYAEDHNVTGMQVLDDPLHDNSASSGSSVLGTALRPVPDFSISLAYAARDPACKPLEVLATQMIAALGKKKKEMEEKEETLRTSMRSALEHAKTAAQNKGDLDGVLLFEEAAKNPDSTTRSDNESLREIYKTRDEAKAGYRVAYDQDCVRILTAAVAQLGKMKADETKKGNFALAKEVATYEKSVQGGLDRLQNSLKRSGGAIGGTTARRGSATESSSSANSVARTGSTSIGGTSRNITVLVDKENGASLGRFEKDEIIALQYLSGEYKPYRGASRTINPDQEREMYYVSEGAATLEGPLNSPNKRAYRIPKGTSTRPFILVVPEPGHFNLKCYAGNYSEGKVTYKMTKMGVLEAREFLKTYDKSAFQTR